MKESGFLLVLGHSIISEKMIKYSAALPEIYRRYEGFYLGVGGPGRGVNTLSGGLYDHSIVFATFPSIENVKGFWHSDEYKNAKSLRKGAGIFNVFAFSGVLVDLKIDQPVFLISLKKNIDNIHTESFWTFEELKNIENNSGLILADSNSVDLLEGDMDGYIINVTVFPNEDLLNQFWLSSGNAIHSKDSSIRRNYYCFSLLGLKL